MESLSEQISLTEAMSEARVPELPKEWTEKERIWVQALVRVQKVNTKINWALAYNDGSGNPCVYKDYGSTAKIAKILSINPFSYLQEKYQPDLRNKNDITTYLVNNGYNERDIRYLLGTKKKDGSDKTEEEKKRDREMIKKLVVRESVLHKINETNERITARKKSHFYDKSRAEKDDLV